VTTMALCTWKTKTRFPCSSTTASRCLF